MSPNSVFWYLFFKIFLGGMPPDPLALACFACWVCFAHLHHQKGPLFLKKNLPTLSSAYGPEHLMVVTARWSCKSHFLALEHLAIVATCKYLCKYDAHRSSKSIQTGCTLLDASTQSTKFYILENKFPTVI